jgi:hypothetical protein
MKYVISIEKRYNHASTHYSDPRNHGITDAKCVPRIYIINKDGENYSSEKYRD